MFTLKAWKQALLHSGAVQFVAKTAADIILGTKVYCYKENKEQFSSTATILDILCDANAWHGDGAYLCVLRASFVGTL